MLEISKKSNKFVKILRFFLTNLFTLTTLKMLSKIRYDTFSSLFLSFFITALFAQMIGIFEVEIVVFLILLIGFLFVAVKSRQKQFKNGDFGEKARLLDKIFVWFCRILFSLILLMIIYIVASYVSASKEATPELAGKAFQQAILAPVLANTNALKLFIDVYGIAFFDFSNYKPLLSFIFILGSLPRLFGQIFHKN